MAGQERNDGRDLVGGDTAEECRHAAALVEPAAGRLEVAAEPDELPEGGHGSEIGGG
jgi:hypothetical protein